MAKVPGPADGGHGNDSHVVAIVKMAATVAVATVKIGLELARATHEWWWPRF